jgi:hypothetical protein
MRNNNFNFNFLNKYYIRQKENELKRLEAKKDELTKALQSEEVRKKDLIPELSKLKNENIYLKEQYKNLKSIVIKNGICLSFENISFNLKEWDNLMLRKNGSNFIITTKYGEEIYLLERKYAEVAEEIFQEDYTYSLVVIRVTSKLIKCQLRFIEKE